MLRRWWLVVVGDYVEDKSESEGHSVKGIANESDVW